MEAAGHGDASASLDGDPGLFLRFRDAALRRKAGREQKRDRDGVATLHELPPRSVQPAGCPVLADPQFRVGLQKQIDLVRPQGRAPELELADGLEPIEHKSRRATTVFDAATAHARTSRARNASARLTPARFVKRT